MVRIVADVLLSTPSIVAGAFIWSIVVVTLGDVSALAGALALVVLMWPIIARATEECFALSRKSCVKARSHSGSRAGE